MKFGKAYLIVPVLMCVAVGAVAQEESPLPKPNVIQQDQFFIVGIEARTTTANEMSGHGIIPKQWQRFFAEGILQKVPNKADQNIYAVYTDFADKRYGEYSIIIGARVTDKSALPPGMVLKTIPTGKYAVFHSDKGPVAKVVPTAWQRISEAEDRGKLGFTRTYRADYELYSAATMDPQNVQVDLYIGVK